MEKLQNLLTTLELNGLNKTYSNAIKSISLLRDTLIAAKDEVDNEILNLMSDGKYLELSRLAPIPSMCSEVVELFNSLIEKSSITVIVDESEEKHIEEVGIIEQDKTVEIEVKSEGIEQNKVNDIVVETSEIVQEVEEKSLNKKVQKKLQFDNDCVHYMNEIDIGSKIMHKTLGVGYVMDIEDSYRGGVRQLIVLFNNEHEPRRFSFAPDTLKRHFFIEVDENISEDIYEYKGIVTCITGLKVGAKILHKSFGIGEILGIEDNEKTNSKVLSVKFEKEEKPKKFSCNSEVLLKYFGIKEENKSDLMESEDENIGNEVDLYNYDIAIPKELKRLLHKIETIMYRNNKNIDKVLCSDYYRYTVDKKRVCNIGWGSKYLSIYFYIPEGELEDKKGLLKLNKGHHIRGTYKLRVDRSIALEDVEYYILQALKYDK